MDLVRSGILVAGALTLGTAVGHVFFYRAFGWAADFGAITRLNRRVLYTIHVALYLLLMLLGCVSVRYPDELSGGEGLGGGIAQLCAAFWLWRLVWQLLYFRPGEHNVGRAMRGFHYGLIALFAILVLAYGAPTLMRFLH